MPIQKLCTVAILAQAWFGERSFSVAILAHTIRRTFWRLPRASMEDVKMLTIITHSADDPPPVSSYYATTYTVLCGTEIIYKEVSHRGNVASWGVVAHNVLSLIYELADPEDDGLLKWMKPDGHLRLDDDPERPIQVYNRIQQDGQPSSIDTHLNMLEAMINNGLTPENVQFCKVTGERVPPLSGTVLNSKVFHSEWVPPHVGWRPPRGVVKEYLDRYYPVRRGYPARRDYGG